MIPLKLHPVSYFDFYGVFKDIFRHEKEETCSVLSDTTAAFLDPLNPSPSDLKNPTYKLEPSGLVTVLRNNPHDLAKGSIVSKFILLTAVRYKGDYRAAESFVMYKLMELDVPYFRVAKDYYKLIEKDNRYGGTDKTFKAWSKDTISDDHGKSILKLIPKYDDFTIVPDNTNFTTVHKNCYNLYSPFAHEPATPKVTAHDIPHSIGVLKHIFGEHYEHGLRYLKCLYQHPKQILPILVLVSEERVTGKTTFMNWLQMIFGDNSISINPESITSQFNATYATKNLILIDETVMEKSTGVEKLKSIATAKTITVNQKHIQGYTVPFFGKIVMCTNKERDFMRIDKAEVRFWIRKINSITGKKNIKIEDDLFTEIPAFLRFLTQLPELDFTRSRMLFTDEEISTSHLQEVKEESRSQLYKEIAIMIDDFFHNSDAPCFEATALDIKKEWFPRDHNYSRAYILKVLTQEMKLKTEKNKRYQPFNKVVMSESPVGRPFKITRTVETIAAEPVLFSSMLPPDPNLDDL